MQEWAYVRHLRDSLHLQEKGEQRHEQGVEKKTSFKSSVCFVECRKVSQGIGVTEKYRCSSPSLECACNDRGEAGRMSLCAA